STGIPLATIDRARARDRQRIRHAGAGIRGSLSVVESVISNKKPTDRSPWACCPLMTETTRLLRDLVAIPSVNPMGRDLKGPQIYEHRVTAYLEDFFRGLGVSYERQAV